MSIEKLLNLVAQKNGNQLKSYFGVTGGEINDCFCVEFSGNRFFVKINNHAAFPSMLEKEAIALNLLQVKSTFLIPKVIDFGILDDKQYLLLEWIEPNKPTEYFWKIFAHQLAGLHKCTNRFYGLDYDNYIGNLPQKNEAFSKWGEFYESCRIMPLIVQLYESKLIENSMLKKAENFSSKLNTLFPEEAPALLHGDLWGGNYMIGNSGMPVLIDPAIYYGHREMDLGMMKLFGGFDEKVFAYYNEASPLEKGWEGRISLTQLYPLLVHAVLYNGKYLSEAIRIIERYV